MRLFLKCFALLCLFCAMGAQKVLAQEIDISLERNKIGLNEVLQITATIQNERVRKYSDFPELSGFRKGGVSSSSNTSIVNGRVSISQSITQEYYPQRKGTFRIPAFRLQINGKTADFAAAQVTVGDEVQRRAFDPFAEFFGTPSQRQPQEFVDVKEDAFFAVTPNKKEIYVGEGVTIDISFYVSLTNRAQMSFYKIGDQLADILKAVKPANCWEENFGIDQINPEYVTLNGKQYRQYRIYTGTFFPLNVEDINLPSAGLKMIKYKEAKNPTFFGQNKQEDYKVFYSKAKKIRVKALPPHPLKDGVAVGNYRLKEAVDKQTFETGKSFSYRFKIEGEGNIASISKPIIAENEQMIFYPPNVQQRITRANGRVYGSKTFDYFVEPQEPGQQAMRNFLYWIYFNPRKAKYDTLRPKFTMKVTGESKKNEMISQTALTGFYAAIGEKSNRPEKTTDNALLKIVANSIIVLLLLSAAALVFFRKRKQQAD